MIANIAEHLKNNPKREKIGKKSGNVICNMPSSHSYNRKGCRLKSIPLRIEYPYSTQQFIKIRREDVYPKS